MNKDQREILHNIIIDLRKSLMEDNDEIRASVAQQITRLYELYRETLVGREVS